MCGPNPLGPQDRDWVFAFKALDVDEDATVTLYNLSGELITRGFAAPSDTKIVLRVGPWAAGVYVAVFERNHVRALILRKCLRLAIMR